MRLHSTVITQPTTDIVYFLQVNYSFSSTLSTTFIFWMLTTTIKFTPWVNRFKIPSEYVRRHFLLTVSQIISISNHQDQGEICFSHLWSTWKILQRFFSIIFYSSPFTWLTFSSSVSQWAYKIFLRNCLYWKNNYKYILMMRERMAIWCKKYI